MSLALSGSFDTAQLPRIADEPVTLTVARRIKPGHEAEFLAWADDVLETVAKFHGSLGAGVLHPGPDGGEYQIVFRFIDGLHLREWERSPQRRALMARAERFVDSERLQRTVGVENWFDLSNRAEPQRSTWKRILTDVAWVYPVALSTSIFVAPFLARMPMEARTLTSAALITVVMRLAVGPMRSKLRSRRSL
jgi:antibiotic biosynthesis monooxygenase (ABM) superfamily enzyme